MPQFRHHSLATKLDGLVVTLAIFQFSVLTQLIKQLHTSIKSMESGQR